MNQTNVDSEKKFDFGAVTPIFDDNGRALKKQKAIEVIIPETGYVEPKVANSIISTDGALEGKNGELILMFNPLAIKLLLENRANAKRGNENQNENQNENEIEEKE